MLTEMFYLLITGCAYYSGIFCLACNIFILPQHESSRCFVDTPITLLSLLSYRLVYSQDSMNRTNLSF